MTKVPGERCSRNEPTALTDDEWASLESLHDRYLADFDRLRLEVMVPLVREAQAAKDVQRDAAEDDAHRRGREADASALLHFEET